jgi:hypothetical protein
MQARELKFRGDYRMFSSRTPIGMRDWPVRLIQTSRTDFRANGTNDAADIQP